MFMLVLKAVSMVVFQPQVNENLKDSWPLLSKQKEKKGVSK